MGRFTPDPKILSLHGKNLSSKRIKDETTVMMRTIYLIEITYFLIGFLERKWLAQ
jgi:hypothetical protein